MIKVITSQKEEIVLILGYPASGKTTLVSQFNGYCRLNRDQIGGKVSSLAAELESRIKSGVKSFVLDNTFPTIESRRPFVEVAEKYGIPIRCVWLKTSIEDSQFNASLRMVRKYGRILDLDEIKEKSKKDPNCFAAAPLFIYRKTFEEPTLEEGFSDLKKVKFTRVWDKAYTNKAIILDYDGTLRETKGGGKYPQDLDDIRILPNTTGILQRYIDQGYLLCGVSNQSWVGKGVLTYEEVESGLNHTNELIGLDIDFLFCKHKVPPISCHCRKPQTGLGVQLIEKYKLSPAECIMVGDQTTDKTFAKRCGFQFKYANDFFVR